MTSEVQPEIKPERLLAGQQVVIKVMLGIIGKIGAAGRKDLEPEIDTDDSVPAYLPNGTRVGKVKRTKAAESARVTDHEAFLKWVRKHRPDCIQESVTAEFTSHCLTRLKEKGVPVLADGSIVPGIEMVAGSASYIPEPYDDAEAAVLAYVQERGLSAVLAIEPGEPQ